MWVTALQLAEIAAIQPVNLVPVKSADMAVIMGPQIVTITIAEASAAPRLQPLHSDLR